ncbi:mechanosensitive ion channel domain-containing protein [Hydrogenophilus thermoluteolus]|uniref:Mechanosensitive ion channel protein MscS n=1 Tax=Hydrogenophilus thermoluteolus TaxID=297 RepID=A0A2Z6DWX0_HYDTE|nr:mechanosensitive ion channel domain-containing protein [Hydrogenophilus thermoluteolus]BBD76937.1 mechanosensitive ion channel protein MscS [Hydrogenophilus thermoluteolus]
MRSPWYQTAPLLLFSILLLGVPALPSTAAENGNNPQPTASTTAEGSDPISLIDRALQSDAASNRAKDLLLKLRDRAIALQKLEMDLQLRQQIAEQSIAASREQWATLRHTSTPNLTQQYREVVQKQPEAAAEWLQRTEEKWLNEKSRWENEIAALERQTNDPPAELTRPIDPPPGTAQAVQTIAQLLQLRWEKAQQLWQTVQKLETQARSLRLQIVEKQLEIATAALAEIDRLRPKSSEAQARWQNDPLWQQIAERNDALKAILTQINQKIDALKQSQEQTQKKLEAFQQQLKRLETRAKTHGLTPLLGFQLIELRNALTEWRNELAQMARTANDALNEWQQIEIELVQAQQRHTTFAQAVEARIAQLPPEEQNAARQAFQRLLEARQATLARIAALRNTITQTASDLEATTAAADRFSQEALATLQGFLLWAKSALPWWSVAQNELGAIVTLTLPLLKELPKLASSWQDGLFAAAIPFVLWLVWWFSLRSLKRQCTQILPKTFPRNASGSRATVALLLLSALQAAGFPLFLLFLAQLVRHAPGTSLPALGEALTQTAFLWWNLHFWRIVLTDHGGLLQYRYRIPETNALRIRRNLLLFVWVTALIATLVTYLYALPPHEESGTPLRSALLIETLWLTLFFAWFFHPTKRADLFPRLPPFGRRMLWLVLLLPPLASTLLLVIGYLYTAEAVLIAYWRSMWALLSVALGYDLVRGVLDDRWRTVARRKMSEARTDTTAEPLSAQEQQKRLAETNQEIENGSRQLQRIVRWSAWLTLGALLLWFWAPLLPALTQLDEWVLWRYQEVSGNETLTLTVTVADLLFTLVALFVLTLLTRNAPTLLELLLAQTRRLDDGAKYAIVTLFRYLLITVGMVWILSRLGMPWSKLQWLVAALSVGLGFGLQEIVANFVSGLIILFERPIRVGDIVTVEGISGKVKRMTIRATVIETWDKQEVLIPNKAIITGNVTNWTLSDLQSRIVIPVGVAYGSDLDKVRHVLLEVAHAHPNILKDPEPSVAFIQYGASSIDFELRCFVADIGVRVQTHTELALAIDKAFRENGIEIPFPQRDLHLRSVAPEALAALRGIPSSPTAPS